MAGQGPLNYTTSIDVHKTAFECLELLHRYGATRHGLVNRKGGVPIGMTFTIETKWGTRAYEILVESDLTLKVLESYYEKGKIQRRFATKEQADRVAWRVIKDWLESQLAIIEAGLMSVEKVMSAHMLIEPHKTMLDLYDENQPALEG